MAAIDINRIATAAADAYLRGASEQRQNGKNGRRSEESKEGKDRHLGGVGAVALGVGLAVAARAAYNRARRFDLQSAAESVESKIRG